MNKRQYTYVALTTTNPQTGWSIVAVGHNKTEVKDFSENKLHHDVEPGHVRDIYADTELKNLRVVSKTKAIREYHIDADAIAFGNWIS
jgi:hypothetical protein